MQKTAQKRSLFNKLREMTDIGGIAAEKLFNPEFEDLMNKLRGVDDQVRAIVSGEQIGEAAPPDDGVGVKSLLKSIQSNLNRREYMRAVADLGRFHKKMDDAVRALSSFRGNIDSIHEKFLFQDLDEESRKHLQDLRKRLANRTDKNMVKEANILDFFTNIATERGRALAAWEKRYPKQVSKLKKDTETLLNRSASLLSVALSTMKELATARSTRKVDNYIALSEKIIKAYGAYDAEFKKYYAENIKGFLEKQDLIPHKETDDKEPNTEITERPRELDIRELTGPQHDTDPVSKPPVSYHPPTIKELAERPNKYEQEGMTVKKPYVAKAPPMRPEPLPAFSLPPSGLPKTAPPSQTPEEQMYQQIEQPGALMALRPNPNVTLPSATFEEEKSASINPSHRLFAASIEAMSNESPLVLASHIKRYAQSIRETDPRSSILLLKISNSIGT